MRHEKAGLKEEIRTILQTRYHIDPTVLIFHPIGEESVSYVVKDGENKYLVKYRLDIQKLDSISQVNTLLFELSHYPFIVAPLKTVDGKTEILLPEGIVYVFPFIEGTLSDVPNPDFPKALVEALTEIMIKVHNTRDLRSPVPKEEFKPWYRSIFQKIVLLAKDHPQAIYAKIIDANQSKIEQIITNHENQAASLKKNPPPFVLTHGDITMFNFIESAQGVKLIDWDESMMGPKEFDLIFFVDNPHFDEKKYLSETGQKEIDKDIIQYYKDRWALDSIVKGLNDLATKELGAEDIKEKLSEVEEYLGYY
jgi:hypothetical protein